MNRVLCQIVVRNEADRYWQSWLDWHVPIFGADNVHVYDDNSTDATSYMASEAGVAVTLSAGPSFMEHEGLCRQAAWVAMEKALQPEAGDWVFCIDADEFFVAKSDEVATLATPLGGTVAFVRIPEVFEVEWEGDSLVHPKVRVDGWWGRVMGSRLFRWQPGGVFADKTMGSGSEPTYVAVGIRGQILEEAWLLHYGYALEVDRVAKYQRYGSVDHGHAQAHIDSILQEPMLTPWTGPWIPVRVGR